VEIATAVGVVHVINTHLGLGRHERCTQAQLLAGAEWIGSAPMDQPLVLMGDFNSRPRSLPFRIIANHLRDIRGLVAKPVARATYPSSFPVFALDHIFINHQFEVARAFVHHSPLARIASDHVPLIADLTALRSPVVVAALPSDK
jgi:endonuclease/exonuclease/phosphatase family metal-dependent hydrolase